MERNRRENSNPGPWWLDRLELTICSTKSSIVDPNLRKSHLDPDKWVVTVRNSIDKEHVDCFLMKDLANTCIPDSWKLNRCSALHRWVMIFMKVTRSSACACFGQSLHAALLSPCMPAILYRRYLCSLPAAKIIHGKKASHETTRNYHETTPFLGEIMPSTRNHNSLF